ncbi:MAG TPA: hypothetical protein VLH38_04410 [Patescibacteria group bacterium]|nr:hypothetical protein [Patescibacteria group bacterium]
MAPLLTPGYILTLDTVFVPYLRAPTGLSNGAAWQLLLHILNFVLPSQVIEKAIFVAIPMIAAISMHQLLYYLHHALKGVKQQLSDEDWRWATYAGGVLYVANPFTYDRFMAGQYEVLLGYALLPLGMRYLLEFVDRPESRTALRLGLLATLLGVVGIPALGELGLAAISVFIFAVLRRKAPLSKYLTGALQAAGLFTLLNCYWLVPAILGKGTVVATLRQFDATHTTAFATSGDNLLIRLGNVFRLQGFWAESHRLFALPQAALPGWGTIRLCIWALVGSGAIACYRQSRRIAATFGALGLMSALLAAGLFAQQLTRIGYREPQKFAGLVTLVFAVFITFGAARLAAWAGARSEFIRATMPAAVMAVILVFTPTMYWGFARQLRPRHYPAGWTTVDAYLRQQSGTYNTVFLPWHEYMSFDFAGRIIANPGTRYFTNPVIVSNDPELGEIMPPKDSIVTRVGDVVGLEPNVKGDVARRLAGYDVRYVLLAKDYDYKKFVAIVRQPQFRLVRESATMNVYENTLWKRKQ